MLSLKELGSRIAVIGASNAGKSTLAAALSRRLAIPAIHLDQLYFRPHSDWEPRPQAEFMRLHEAAVALDGWVIEGNYFIAMPQRLERATSLIWLDTRPLPSALRYIRRTLCEPNRAGTVEGAPERLKLEFLRYVVFEQPRKRRKYATLLAKFEPPQITLKSMREINACYRHWQLDAAL